MDHGPRGQPSRTLAAARRIRNHVKRTKLQDGLYQAVSAQRDIRTDCIDRGWVAETRKCNPCIAVALPYLFHSRKVVASNSAPIDFFLRMHVQSLELLLILAAWLGVGRRDLIVRKC